MKININYGKAILFSLMVFFVSLQKIMPVDIDKHNLRQMLGQMLMVGIDSYEVDEKTAGVINNLNLGGIILFSRNIKNPQQLKKLNTDLKQISQTPLFIAVDAEGGSVNRLNPEKGFDFFPSVQEVGLWKNLCKTKSIASKLASQLFDVGFNVNFAPVVDVNVNPDNPIIGGRRRAFSSDPIEVHDQAREFILAHHENNIITAIKHFPGHGSSTADSHNGMVDITDTYSKEVELLPYYKLISDGIVDMVMTAHVINKNIDSEYPATLSKLFIENILRKEMKFDGVVITDDLGMGAISDNYDFENVLVRAVNAGCDILLIGNKKIQDINGEAELIGGINLAEEAIEVLFNAVQENQIPFSRIIESVNRIQKLKSEYLCRLNNFSYEI